MPGTGAHRSGLAGARGVIVAVNGLPVSNSLASYCDAVAGVRSGEQVTFSLLEPGSSKPRDVAVRME